MIISAVEYFVDIEEVASSILASSTRHKYNMFIKLNKNIHIPEYSANTSIIEFVDKLKYSTVSVPFNDIFSLVPKIYRDKFLIYVMEITGSLGPHTDSEILSTINIYVNPDDCTTKFFDIPKDSMIDTVQIKNQTNGKVFKASQLSLYGSFIAETDEAWLLDVTNPHSVTSNKIDSSKINRTAIVLQTKFYSFEQVQEMLKETGYL
jgi:hypothetical protein